MDDKDTLIIKLGSPIGRNQWQRFNFGGYGEIEAECYDKNGNRFSSSLFFDKDDDVTLVNTGYSIGVSINARSFLYADSIRITKFTPVTRIDLCYGEIKQYESMVNGND